MSSISSSINIQSEAVPHKRGCLFYVKRGLLVLVILIIALPLTGFAYESLMAPGDDQRYPPPGQMVNVDGHQMHINCTGEGSPTVILEAGFASWSTAWPLAQPELSNITRTCSYDRAGLGWSDAGPEPRDPQQIATELHTLLMNAGIQGPYVLVGHSIGGKHIRLFTELYPEEVTGLVFVDARHESAEPVGRTPEQNALDTEAYIASFNLYRTLRQFGVARLLGLPLAKAVNPVIKNEPDDNIYRNVLFGVREPIIQATIAESSGSTGSDEQLRAARPLADLPIIVLTADTSLQVPDWENVQKNLVALSTNSRWTVVNNSGHNIQSDQPAVLVDAVHDVIASASTGEPLAQ